MVGIQQDVDLGASPFQHGVDEVAPPLVVLADADGDREREPKAGLVDRLGDRDDLERRAPTVAFNVAGHSAAEVARTLAGEQIAVWDGNYYALEAMSSFGVEGAVRAGIAVYVSPDDVNRLIDAVQRL